MSKVLALASMLSASTLGCASVVVYGERHADSPETQVIRVAEELGISEPTSSRFLWQEADSDSLRLEIPLEIRAQGVPVVLPGCAVRPFRMDPITGSSFQLGSISAREDIRLEVLEDADSIVRPGERRQVTVLVVARGSSPSVDAFGIRLDEAPGVTALRDGCPGEIRDTGPDVQHYGLRRLEVEPGGLGAAAVAVALFGIVLYAR